MQNPSYKKIIVAKTTPEDAFNKISRVSEWWAKNFEGKSKEEHDIFTVRFGSGAMYTCNISKIIPNKKIVWAVIDCYQGWLKKPTEWVGTKLVWAIVEKKDSVEVIMTHEGLVPELECFEKCTGSWNYLMEKSLQKFLDTNEGIPA